MLDFAYEGECRIGSEHLVDLLDMANQFLLADLKHTCEELLIKNVSTENFLDTYMVSKGFDCMWLRDQLMTWGRTNL